MPKRWEPVEDGVYRAANPKDCIEVEGSWLTVHETLVEGKPGTVDTIIALPDRVRLCRLVESDAPGVTVAMTPERVAALRELHALAEFTMGYSSVHSGNLRHAMDVVRAMLDEAEVDDE